MTYIVELSKKAYKALKSIPNSDLRKIRNKIEKLKKTPLPRDHKKLEGNHDLYRLRSGNYRIIYQFNGEEVVILVLKIGHRREIYR